MRMVEYILPSCSQSMSWIWERRLLVFLVASCLADTTGPASAEDPYAETTWAYQVGIVREGVSSTPSSYEGIVCGRGRDTRRVCLYRTDCVSPGKGRSDPEHIDVLVKGNAVTALSYSTIKGWERFTPERGEIKEFSPAEDQGVSDMLNLAMYLTPLAHSGASAGDAPDTFLPFFARASAEQEVQITVPPSWDATSGMKSAPAISAKTYLSHPPTGRVLRKATLPDGTLRCEMQDGVSRDLLVGVQIRPAIPPARPFDANSVGTGALVPVQYCRYWECTRAFLMLPEDRRQRPAAATVLTQRINNSLRDISRETIRISLLDLLLQSAIASGDRSLLYASIQTYATELRTADRSLDETLAGFAHMSSVLGNTLDDPNVTSTIRPHLEQVILARGISNRYLLRRVLTNFDRQGAYSLRFLATDAVRRAGSIDERALDEVVEPLEIMRLSKHVEQSDPNEATQSMRDLMAKRGSPPVRGDLQWAQLEALVAHGCGRHLSHLSSEDRDDLVKGILDYVSKAAGQGPYRQQRPELEEGLGRLIDARSKGNPRPPDLPSLLGALLALSFYDTSTPDDHRLLRQQIQSIWDETEAELRQSLRSKGWGEWGTDEAWDAISKPIMTRIAAYIDDPLWPMFKYPLSRNEMSRLRNSMRCLAMSFDGSIQGLLNRLDEAKCSQRPVDRLQFEIRRVLYRLPGRLMDLRIADQCPIGYWLLNDNLLLVYRSRPMEVGPQEQVTQLLHLYLGHRTEDIANHR